MKFWQGKRGGGVIIPPTYKKESTGSDIVPTESAAPMMGRDLKFLRKKAFVFLLDCSRNWVGSKHHIVTCDLNLLCIFSVNPKELPIFGPLIRIINTSCTYFGLGSFPDHSNPGKRSDGTNCPKALVAEQQFLPSWWISVVWKMVSPSKILKVGSNMKPF